MRDYYNSILGSDVIEPEEFGTVQRYIGDKPKVTRVDETQADEMLDHSDEQGWE